MDSQGDPVGFCGAFEVCFGKEEAGEDLTPLWWSVLSIMKTGQALSKITRLFLQSTRETLPSETMPAQAC